MKKSSAGDVNKGQQLQGLHGLPAELLDAVLSQLDAHSRLPVFRTSKLLATALLRMCPRIRLTYPTQHDIIGQHLRELAPFLTEVLRNRQQPKLHLTLLPARSLTDATTLIPVPAVENATQLVAWMLGAVPLCGAVDSLTFKWRRGLDLPWEPDFSATLASSFPSVTSLTFLEGSFSIDHLAKAISHPLLSPRLLHLKLELVIIPHEGQPGRSPFIDSRLQELRLHDVVDLDEEPEFLYGLLPLPPTLTQLEVIGVYGDRWDWVRLAAAVSSLAQLQQLRLFNEKTEYDSLRPDFMALLSALAHLPSLHTLEMFEDVVGQEQLDALLALTKITCLSIMQLDGLTSSRASAACSWRQLKVHTMDWDTAADLPLHNLTHPLHLHQLVGDIEETSVELLAAAELNLCERNKAGLEVEDMWLSQATVDLLTEQYLNHSHPTAQQPPHPTVASSSSHSGPSTSLASSSSHSGPSISLASSSSHSGPSTSLASSSSHSGPSISLASSSSHSGPSTSLASSSSHSGPSISLASSSSHSGPSTSLASSSSHSGPSTSLASSSSHSGPSTSLASSSSHSGPSTSLASSSSHSGPSISLASSSSHSGPSTSLASSSSHSGPSISLASSSSHSGPSTSLASSSSHSGPSTSLASSSSPEGHITPGRPGSSIGEGGQQVLAAKGQALMQRLGCYVKELHIRMREGEEPLSSDARQALAVLFPNAVINGE
ncbi:hypothetical protein QJQ45_010680 [Haematococcus lacustris]|nr:hypothetical protein QJQ45_010680 [Haematococcus lacustris]